MVSLSTIFYTENPSAKLKAWRDLARQQGWRGGRRGRKSRGWPLFLVFIGFAAGAQAADRYWVGSAGGNIDDTANWASSDPASCTGGGASVPGASDVAIFDPDCDNSATVNANWSVQGINIQSGYSGTVTQSGSNTLTVGSGNYVQADGTFTGGSGTITVNGSLTLSSGSFANSSGGMTVSGDLAVNGGTLSGTGSVTVNGGDVSGNGTWRSRSSTGQTT